MKKQDQNLHVKLHTLTQSTLMRKLHATKYLHLSNNFCVTSLFLVTT
jgi:hypothetical protein